MSNMRTSYGLLGGMNDSPWRTRLVELLAKRPDGAGWVERWTAGRKALALFPVRSARPNSRPRCCASVEDGRPRCHIHRRGRGQIPLGRPLSRPYPAGHSENPADTRAVIGIAAPVTTGSRLLVTGAARLAAGSPIRRNNSVCLPGLLLLAAIGAPRCSCARSLCPHAGASMENHCNLVTGFSLDRTSRTCSRTRHVAVTLSTRLKQTPGAGAAACVETHYTSPPSARPVRTRVGTAETPGNRYRMS